MALGFQQVVKERGLAFQVRDGWHEQRLESGNLWHVQETLRNPVNPGSRKGLKENSRKVFWIQMHKRSKIRRGLRNGFVWC
jgi:hypothetical protein